MKKITAIVIVLVLAAAGPGWAGRVLLKNGKTINGDIKNRSGDTVWIAVKIGDSAGSIGVNINEVDFIYEDNGDISKFSPKSETESIAGMTDKLISDISELRHLGLKNKIESDIMTADEIKDHLIKTAPQYISEEEIKSEEKIFKRMGLVEENFDYMENTKEFATHEVAGFYDDVSKKLYLSASVPEQFRQLVLPHEIMHALQDQNFDLQKFLPKENKDLDFELARQSLAEGDASITSMDYLLHQQNKNIKDFPDFSNLQKESMENTFKQNPAFAKSPTFIKEITLFPYLQGSSFVHKILQNYSYDKINEIYLSPPVSTEQIIHPEKFLFEKDAPMQIDIVIDNAPLGSLKEIYKSTWGEYVIYNFLKTYVNLLEAKAASEGWGKDIIIAYEDQGTKEVVLFWLTAWDTAKDAAEFYDIYKQALSKRYPDLKEIQKEDKTADIKTTAWDTSKGKIYMGLDNANVTVIEGIRLDPVQLSGLVQMKSKRPH